MDKSKKAIAAEEIFVTYLNSPSNAINSKEEQEAFKWLNKIPEGTDHEIARKVMKKMGSLHVFRYAGNINFEYLADLKDILKDLLSDAIQSTLMINCLYYSLQNNNTPESYSAFCETAIFLQYVDKFQQPVKKAEQLAKSDKFITAAVIKDIEFALTNIDFRLRDQRALGPFVYVLSKSNSNQCENMVLFQDKDKQKFDRLFKLKIIKLALDTNKTLPNVLPACNLVDETLKTLKK